MNVKRFTARTSRDALNLVRQALGDDAVVLSTKPCADGVEVLAMAPDSMAQIERIAAPAAAPRPAAKATTKAAPARPAAPKPSASAQAEVGQDVEQLAMTALIEEGVAALAFMEKLQRQPGQARLTQKLLDCGFSPALIRKLSESMSPDVVDESAWAASVLERNLCSTEAEAALEDQ